MSDQSGDGSGAQPVQVDWSRLPIVTSLIQQQPSDAGSLMAMLGVDMTQSDDTQTA